MSMCLEMAAPVGPNPGTMLTTPAGNPTSSTISASLFVSYQSNISSFILSF